METKVCIIIIICLIIYIIYNNCNSVNISNNNITENFATNVADADISAIRNLNGLANTLMQPNGTLTNPGNLNINGNLGVTGTLSIPKYTNVSNSLDSINSSIGTINDSINTINNGYFKDNGTRTDGYNKGSYGSGVYKFPGGFMIQYGRLNCDSAGNNCTNGDSANRPQVIFNPPFKQIGTIHFTLEQPQGHPVQVAYNTLTNNGCKVHMNGTQVGLFWTAFGTW